jgi:UDP-glucose 4-epimerase
MKVFVTGGAGYVGSATCERLIAAGHDVVVFDNLQQGHRAAVPEEAVFIEGDLNSFETIHAALNEHRPDGVMHFAANSLVGESMEKPMKYLGENVTNAANLLNAMTETGVKRFILSSTANLFAEPETLPISESERIVPGSAYGESKYLIERMLPWLERTVGLRYACLRYFNAAGATETRGEDHDPETHLIPLVLQVALGQRDKIKVFGSNWETPDGTCVRDYIHVWDLASAHLKALEALEEKSRIYNLGNGQGFSVLEVIEAAREITGHSIPAEMAPRRDGDVAKLVADSATIRNELGWDPEFPELRSIVKTAWRWHRDHPDGYAD